MGAGFFHALMTLLLAVAQAQSRQRRPETLHTLRRCLHRCHEPGRGDSNFGPDIPQDKMKSCISLKERTTRVGTAGERGTGFGPPLAARFVKLMGGELRVESGPFTDQSTLCLTALAAFLPAEGVVRPAAGKDGILRPREGFLARCSRLGRLALHHETDSPKRRQPLG